MAYCNHNLRCEHKFFAHTASISKGLWKCFRACLNKTPVSSVDSSGGDSQVKIILWFILLVLCWPLALLLLFLYPLIWLLMLPFRLIGVTVNALFDLIKALFGLPARILRA